MVRTLAIDIGKEAVLILDDGKQSYGVESDWIVISSNQAFLEHPAITSRIPYSWTGALENEVRWTDDYSNLFGILRFERRS